MTFLISFVDIFAFRFEIIPPFKSKQDRTYRQGGDEHEKSDAIRRIGEEDQEQHRKQEESDRSPQRMASAIESDGIKWIKSDRSVCQVPSPVSNTSNANNPMNKRWASARNRTGQCNSRVNERPIGTSDPYDNLMDTRFQDPGDVVSWDHEHLTRILRFLRLALGRGCV
jgi:hypothetical protein